MVDERLRVQSPHIPVLLEEVLESFKDCDEGYFVDCTLGYAGHSYAVLEAHPRLRHIGIDRDDEALEFSGKRLAPFAERSTLVKGTFADVVPTLSEYPITALLADFGVSSLQLDKEDRGFGFESDRLDMRMDNSAPLDAYEVVNHYSRERLEYILDNYGEIRSYKRLAGAIIEARSKAPVESAKELSRIAAQVLPKDGKKHPATLLFQAVRIEVNGELEQIEALLDALEKMRPRGAMIALITFHSLEDRLVKNRFRDWAKACICPPEAIRCTCGKNHAIGKVIAKKPLTASPKELKRNPRSRSAKLRVFRFGS